MRLWAGNLRLDEFQNVRRPNERIIAFLMMRSGFRGRERAANQDREHENGQENAAVYDTQRSYVPVVRPAHR